MTIVNIQCNEQEKKEEEETYSIGDYFIEGDSGELYVLNRVKDRIVTLNCLKDGNCWSNPYNVESLTAITRGELNRIGNCAEFIPVKSVSISYKM